MSNRSRSLTLAALMLWVVTATLAPASAAAQLVEGADYRRVSPPRPTSSPGKIEVLEFFSYGCPHCAKFFPLVSAWAAKLPKDVVLKRVAVSYGRPAWTNLARTYYALLANGDLARFDGALFHAIHDEHLQLFDAQTIAEWIGRNGGDAERFTNAYASFGINNQTVQADQLVEDYQVDAIPTLTINGRYVLLSPGAAEDEEQTFRELLAHADMMIARVRRDELGTPAAAAPAKHK
jgi:protein dithiol oxidoreductase (disulfide-forming)